MSSGTRTKPIFQTTLSKEGILHFEFTRRCFPVIEECRAIIDSIEENTACQSRPFLADIRKVQGLSIAGSRYAREKGYSLGTLSACAILVGSPVSKLVGSFYVGINKPPFPTRLFTSREQALEWLRNYLT